MARNDNGGKRPGTGAPSPNGSPSGRVGRWLEPSGIGSLAIIAGITVGVLAVVTISLSIVGTGWIRDARTSQDEWAGGEGHIHAIYNLAAVQFLSIVDATSGIEEQFVRPSYESVAAHAEELIATQPADIAEAETATVLASAAAFDAAFADAGAADETSLLAPYGPLDQLEAAYLRLQAALHDLSDAITASGQANLDALSTRADQAKMALVIASVLGTATFIFAWALGTRIRRKETTLLTQTARDRELLQTVVDTLPESVVWKDTDSRVLGLNSALEQRLAAHDVEVQLGTKLSDAALGPRMAEYIASIEAVEAHVMKTGEAILDWQMIRPERDGNDRTVLRNTIPLRSGDEVAGVMDTTRDITDVVQLERSLASARRLESIGQISAGVAHEINTPVQYVTDNCSFLQGSFVDLVGAVSALSAIAEAHDPEATALIKKEADLDFLLEEIPDAVGQSREGLEQIARIVRAMKAFAHPGGDMVQSDINSLIATTVDVSRNEWKYHSDVALELAEDLPYPRCDEGQIKQVLLNMIINAADAIADATPEGSSEKGTITIATAPGRDAITIRITDTGTGISPEVQARMFERFFTTKPVGRGSGQGLAICYDAVTAHGGSIEVASTVGVGTTFTITLPLDPPERTTDLDDE